MALFAATVAVYSPSVAFDFVYDDTQVVALARAPKSFADVVRIFTERHFYNLPYYRPVTRSTLLMQKSLWGGRPAPFHLFNVILAGAAAVLAFLLLGAAPFGLPPARAACAAALFALHPVASSCVYPVSSGRETLLPAVWILAAVYCWVTGRVVGAWVLFALALFSKESAVVTPLLFALTGGGPWRRYLPAVPILAVYFAIRAALFGGSEFVYGALTGPLFALAYAAQTFVLPFLDLHYEPPFSVWFSPLRQCAAALAFAGLIFLRPRQTPYLLAWFAIALLPTANLLRQETPYDERHLLLASVALCAGTALVVPPRFLIPVILAAALVSWRRGTFFTDDLAFSRQWMKTDPNNANAPFNLGYALARRGRHAEAVEPYRLAVRLRPDYARAHNNLGDALLQASRAAEAEHPLREALRLDPTLAEAHYNLGLALAQSGRPSEAVGPLAEAVRLMPGSPEAHNNFAIVLAINGRTQEAAAHWRRALELKPDYDDARRNLTLVEQGK